VSAGAGSLLLLAVESASRTASAALFRGHQLLGARSSAPEQHHSETVLALIASLLDEHAAAADDLDAFAVGIGPGAFTSIRIGVATIKGLAFQSERPVAPVSTLAAIAHQCFSEHAEVNCVIAAIDARLGQIYAGTFELDRDPGSAAGAARLRGAEALLTTRAVLESAPRGARVAGELPPRLAESVAEAARSDLVILPSSAQPRAVAVGSLGLAALARGEWLLASALAPRYLQLAEAEQTRRAAESPAAGGASASLDTPGKL